ncbi:MAG: F-type H+-transporting ATPase subunit delta [Blastocatellia bacterium]|nr:F-type H+-transporting ATPase subunit delta [Blastocatellia bacterium]
MSIRTIARRYASALADVAIAQNEAREVQAELNAWEAMFAGSPELRQLVDSPTVPLEEKRKVLRTLINRLRPRPTTANFIMVLLQNQRLGQFAEINKSFSQALDARSGVVAATVTTAKPLAQDPQESLRASLAALTGKTVRLSFETDTELIGGLIARIGSTVYDGSVRNQLQQAKERLIGT